MQLQESFVFQFLCQNAQSPLEEAGLHPLLKVAMAGLVGGIALLIDVFPASPAGQQPEDAFKDLHDIGAFAPGGFLLIVGQDRSQAIPLFEGEVHASIIQQLAAIAAYKRNSTGRFRSLYA